jgi:response regulator RpfG family c-di-GMP phosphodiesterase
MSDSVTYRIVVLDDDKIQHLLLRKRFQSISKEIELIAFDQVEEAIAYLDSHAVDQVLTDLNLGLFSGWDFIDELEKINFKGGVFFLTGSILPEDSRRAAQDTRISGFFEKPLSETDLMQILRAKPFFPML